MALGNFTLDPAFQQLTNGSTLQAASTAYMAVWNQAFWSIIFVVFLLILYIKTDSLPLIGMFTIFGNAFLGTQLLPYPHLRVFFYIILSMSLFMLLYKFYGSSKTQ